MIQRGGTKNAARWGREGGMKVGGKVCVRDGRELMNRWMAIRSIGTGVSLPQRTKCQLRSREGVMKAVRTMWSYMRDVSDDVAGAHAITQLLWSPLLPVSSRSTKTSVAGSSTGMGEAMVKNASMTAMCGW